MHHPAQARGAYPGITLRATRWLLSVAAGATYSRRERRSRVPWGAKMLKRIPRARPTPTDASWFSPGSIRA